MPKRSHSAGCSAALMSNTSSLEPPDGSASRPVDDTPAEAGERLRETEQRLRLALASGWLGSWDLDLETRGYVYISDIWKQHFGRPDVGNIMQEDFLEFLHPDDRECVHAEAEAAVQERRDYSTEYRTIWPDGSIHWISAHATLLCDAAGEPKRMVGVTQDITARKTMEQEREQELQEAVERADRDPLTGLLNHRAFHQRLKEETDRAEREKSCVAAVMLDLDNFKFFNDTYGHAVGDRVLRDVADRLQTLCRSYDTLARVGGDEFALLTPGSGEAEAAEIKARLQAGLNDLSFQPGAGEAIPVTVSMGTALFPTETCENGGLLDMADQRLFQAKREGRVGTAAEQTHHSLSREVEGFSLLDSLVAAVDNKDRYTCRHSEDVMEYGLLIAREIGLGEHEQHTLAMAALLHDVGKIGVPDAILRKPGTLTDMEFTAIKQHPQLGAIMVSSVAGLEETLDAVRHHHERWDGAGYPFGLREKEIPLMARLLAVADAFSAMTTDRPYRRGMSRDKALLILEAGSGVQWDPEFVRAFQSAFPLSTAPDAHSAPARAF